VLNIYASCSSPLAFDDSCIVFKSLIDTFIGFQGKINKTFQLNSFIVLYVFSRRLMGEKKVSNTSAYDCMLSYCIIRSNFRLMRMLWCSQHRRIYLRSLM